MSQDAEQFVFEGLIFTVRHAYKKYTIELDEEGKGDVEFDSELLDTAIHLFGKDEQEMIWLICDHDFDVEDESFRSGEPLETTAFSNFGFHMTWKVALSLDHIERQEDEDGVVEEWNKYRYHHTVMVRPTTADELREAEERHQAYLQSLSPTLSPEDPTADPKRKENL